jgi:signal transduction histidine kinase
MERDASVVSEGGVLARLRSQPLPGYAMVLLLVTGIVQLAVSILFYQAIDRQAIREDHARRIAEFLVVSDRIYRLDPSATPQLMTTGHLHAHIATEPSTTPRGGPATADIVRHVVAWEPSLRERNLFLAIADGPRGRRDLAGSMQMENGSWLNFRSTDISSGWAIAPLAMLMTLLIGLACLGIGFFVLHRLTRPLRQLSEAADAISHGGSIAVSEHGTADLRNLARSFNDLQARISGLESDQAKSFEAISHDLRTPLSRLKVASEFVSESDVAAIVSSSAEEMEAMLLSLQSFLRAQHLRSTTETVDLVSETREILSAFAGPTRLKAPEEALVLTYREPLRSALRPLVENALQYGERAEVTIASHDDGWRIEIADDGPGIPSEYFERILDPFFRLDNARQRNTGGFGLGIPTAHRLLQRVGGRLPFAHRAEGGLVVTVHGPGRGAHAGQAGERPAR